MNDWGASAVRLVKRVRKGSAAALEKLYKLCLPRVRSYLRSRAPDLPQADLDDLSQEVMIVAVQGLPRLQKAGSFPAWLLRIARNKLLNWFRDRDPSNPGALDSDLQSKQPDAEATLKQKERDSLLRECIQRLTENQREVIILHYYHDMKVKEISFLLGKPIGTVAPTLKQARERIKKCFESRMQMEEARKTPRD